MKPFITAFSLLLLVGFASGQITYIGITNHNTGTGANNLFNNYVAVGQQCYIDWEVYAEGMSVMEACGFRSRSRLVLRRMGSSDSTSVVASAPIIIPGICGGKNGNNDKYYAELSAYIDKPGRYAVEIQADLPNQTDAFGNASTKTTYNYACPSAYYLTGTSGPTGNYYTPAGACASGPGLSDPVGGPSADRLDEIFTTLKFFTVGEVGTYRQMVIFNGSFYDLNDGKFQPGNPAVPQSLNGLASIPAAGICPVIAAPQLSIGGEINAFLRTDCINGDVLNASLFYRTYKDGTTAPPYNSFNLAFKDNCAFSVNGPESNNFPTGGSCQNANGILDQRWQTISGASSVLPTNFALADTGLWKLDFYTETYGINCAGDAITDRSTLNTTSFTVNNPSAPGSPCSSVIPVILSHFSVTPSANNNLLRWTAEEAVQVTSFEVQQSFDGYSFHAIGAVPYSNGRSSFSYSDAGYPGRTVFYRIIASETSGKKYYSSIVRVSNKGTGLTLSVQPAPRAISITLENVNRGKYQVIIYNNTGSLLLQQALTMQYDGNSNVNLAVNHHLAHGIYYAVIRDEKGIIVAKRNFFY